MFFGKVLLLLLAAIATHAAVAGMPCCSCRWFIRLNQADVWAAWKDIFEDKVCPRICLQRKEIIAQRLWSETFVLWLSERQREDEEYVSIIPLPAHP